ncbi:MAG: alpha/beta fold hydrolase [Flavobacteriales bacterium]|nr:alpha/beta fold hydrolase [Flavobacteriales bacterium]
MKLNYKELGSGQPLLILHGLMGMLDNWQGPAKHYSKHFRTFIIDARNHGHSEHSDEFSYESMTSDLLEFVEDHHLEAVHLMGHSMGGKTAMKFSQNYPEYVSKLIVADISPRQYEVHHQMILAGLNAIDFEKVKSRGEVDEILKGYIPDQGTRQFLMKSMYWKSKNQLALRFNLSAIMKNIEIIGDGIHDRICEVESLFIRGAKSNYVREKDLAEIAIGFPNSTIATIEGAGHWLHAEKPKEYVEKTLSFLLS